MRCGLIWLLLCICLSPFARAAQSSALTAQGGHQAWPRTPAKASIQVSVQPSSYLSYYVDLPSNVATLTASLREATGNADLLIKQGVPHVASTISGLQQESAAFAITGANNEQLILRTGGSPRLTPGRWWITVLNATTNPVSLSLEIDVTASGPALQMQPGMSGAWHQPSKTYQGFFFQVLSETSALATWFTYEPDGSQAYLIGVGTVSGDQVNITELIRTRGGRFGEAFDAASIVREDFGDLVFTFDSCGSGYASYLPSALASAQGWPAEQLQLDRITSISGLSCNATAPASAKALHGGISGAWYDPDRSGEGWLVEVLDPQTAFVYWFSYTPDGEQAWFGNIGRIVDGSIVIDEAIRPVGGRFGAAYNPAQVSLQPWGAFALTQTGCNSAVAAAVGPADYGYFEYTNVVRLSALAGTSPCAFTAATQSVSGTVRAPANTYLDGDVNDPGTPNRDNDVAAQEQVLGNPAIVSGYATASATGRTGDRFATSTDVFDAYTVQIAAGQLIRLVIADHSASAPASIDLDLFLYPANDPNNPLAVAEGTGPLEQIQINQSGTYDIVVKAFSGGSSYLLTVDNAGSAATQQSASLSPFTPMADDQIVLKSRPGLPAKAARQQVQSLGLRMAAGSAETGWLLVADQPAQIGLALARLGAPVAKSAPPWRIDDPELARRQQVIELVKRARARPDLEWVEPNLIHRPLAIPNDPSYPRQWHYPFINLPQAWDLTTGSPSVVAAVLDTGVVPHGDLTPNLRYDLGFDFVRNPSSALDFDGIDANADDNGDRDNPDRSSTFHGSHVAGTIAARSNNGSGVAGVSWTTTLMPVRVLGSGGGTVYDIAQGIRYAAGLPNDSGRVPAQRASVINLSLGGLGSACPQLYADAVAAARQAGVIVVAAAGNDATSQPFFPAACAGVVSVSATDMLGQRAPYSNFGTTVDVAAPGGDLGSDRNADGIADGVLSTHASDRTGTRLANTNLLHGTSMATPHVAGVVALMKSVFPGLSPAQFDSLLSSGAITRDLAGNGPTVRDDVYGFGLIDAFRAVAEARRLAGNPVIPPSLVINPGLLDFGATATSAGLSLANAGGGTLNVTAISSNRPWLSVVATSVNAQGLGNYTVAINRSGLVAASYSGQLSISSSAGNFLVQVSMRVGAATTAGNVGTQYVLLADSVTGVVVKFVQLNPVDGVYAYNFSGVMPGSYFLYSGSDIDNDNSICDAGDSCGAYTGLAQPSLITISNNSVNLAPFVVMPDVRGLSVGAGASAVAAKRVR